MEGGRGGGGKGGGGSFQGETSAARLTMSSKICSALSS